MQEKAPSGVPVEFERLDHNQLAQAVSPLKLKEKRYEGNAMLIKKADDRSADIEILKALSARPDVSQDIRRLIDREVRNIQSGIRGKPKQPTRWSSTTGPRRTG